MKRSQLILAAFLLSVLAACGLKRNLELPGHGRYANEKSAATPASTPAPTPAPVPAPTPVPTPAPTLKAQ